MIRTEIRTVVIRTAKGFILRSFPLLILLALVLPLGLAAQNTAQNTMATGQQQKLKKLKSQVIAGRKLEIGCAQTCVLIFPTAIQSADRGAAYVLAERVKGSENALKVKAGKPGFEPSSLTVITTDGRIFAFEVSYASRPPYLVLDLRGSAAEKDAGHADSLGTAHNGAVDFKDIRLNSAEMAYSIEKVKADDPFIKGVHKHKYGIEFKLDGIYFYKDVLFFRFRLHNSSGIPYRLASLRFFMRDAKRAKRTSVQDNELPALYKETWGRAEDTAGQLIVMAVPRFTIADHKHLAIQLMEQEGDRAVTLLVKERKLRKTRKLYEESGWGLGSGQ